MSTDIIKNFVYPLNVSKGSVQKRMTRSSVQAWQYFDTTFKYFQNGNVKIKTLEKDMRNIVNCSAVKIDFLGQKKAYKPSFIEFDNVNPVMRVVIPVADSLNWINRIAFGKILNKNPEMLNHEALHLFDLINNPKIVKRALNIAKSKDFKEIDEFYTKHMYGKFIDTEQMTGSLLKTEKELKKFLKKRTLSQRINILQYYRNHCLLESRAYNWGAKCQQKFNTEQNCQDSLAHLFRFSIFFKKKYEMLNRLLFETISQERTNLRNRG